MVLSGYELANACMSDSTCYWQIGLKLLFDMATLILLAVVIYICFDLYIAGKVRENLEKHEKSCRGRKDAD